MLTDDSGFDEVSASNGRITNERSRFNESAALKESGCGTSVLIEALKLAEVQADTVEIREADFFISLQAVPVLKKKARAKQSRQAAS